MSNGATPDIKTVLADENFKSLGIGEKDKVLAKIDPNYAALPGRERAHALGVIHYGKDDVEAPQSSPILRSVYGAARGLSDIVEGIYNTVIHPIKTADDIVTSSEEHFRKAQQETTLVGKAAEYGAAVPMLGPFGQQLGERAGKGDVAGAVTEGLTALVLPSVAKGVVRKVFSGMKNATLEVPEKINLPGGFKINRNIPPPPVPPEEIAYNKAKTITEAQEAAQAENVKRTRTAAKARETAFNKEADENLAIQKRYDDAQAERMQAEKVAKNARLKSEQAHEKALREIETARQKELAATERLRNLHAESIQQRGAQQGKLDQGFADRLGQAEKERDQAYADLERLRTMHGDDLMRRGKEVDAAEKAAEQAVKAEESAKQEVTTRQASTSSKPKVTYPGDSGMRPTETEQNLTRLFKKRIWTPQDFRDAVQAMGPDAYRRGGEGTAAYQARIMGMIRSSRAARGMPDIESGRGLPPPPRP
jgi:hypothetical protein